MKLLGKDYPDITKIIREGQRVLLFNPPNPIIILSNFDILRYEYNKREFSSEIPETLRQAQVFMIVRNKYLHDGLCYTCASQAAYGHQLGFSRIWPSCTECFLIVQNFPIEAGNGWRHWERGDRRPIVPGQDVGR